MKSQSVLRMGISIGGSLCRRLIAGMLVSLAAVCMCPDSHAQNIFQKLIGKESVESERHANESKKQKKQKDGKKDAPQVDATELSLDDNVNVPEIPLKQKETVKEHMTALAKKLAKRKVAKIETMREGEVVVATMGTDMLFAPNDTVLMPRGGELLKPYSELVSRHPGMYKFLVVVHTDDTGSDEYTDWLSEKRVEAIYQILNPGNGDLSMVVPYALGATEPRVPNTSMSNRASNRRLEIFVVPDQKLISLAKSNKLTSGM